ncbi:hypothetical protein BS78_03G014900 [Paspalum vaginatum]|nr:hypothetical protein BS78_03G014900 [Paspalum vaginatum]
MGNMLPCLVQQGTAALPAAMNPKRRHISLKLLMKAINKMKKIRHGGKQATIIDRKSKSPSSLAAAATVATDQAILKSKKAGSSNNNPKGAVLRSRLHQHGRGGGLKKGVVRVKVVLTKEEAARLLSLTVGGQKSAAQVVAEIKKVEEARRAANAAASAWRPALESIPEESL